MSDVNEDTVVETEADETPVEDVVEVLDATTDETETAEGSASDEADAARGGSEAGWCTRCGPGARH
jgi:hypothetical protein